MHLQDLGGGGVLSNKDMPEQNDWKSAPEDSGTAAVRFCESCPI